MFDHGDEQLNVIRLLLSQPSIDVSLSQAGHCSGLTPLDVAKEPAAALIRAYMSERARAYDDALLSAVQPHTGYDVCGVVRSHLQYGSQQRCDNS
jgi:hypothetical protein